MLPDLKLFIRQIEAELDITREQRWLQEIVREYETICYMYSLKLKRPLFSLSDCETTLGTWDPVSRELRISRHLIATHPWSTVIGILKHEMAHQVTQELMDGKRDHDAAFREACERIGLREPFNRARVDLSLLNPVAPATPGENEQIVRKVERLLSLAKSDNENEAYAAMEKAQKLMREYNVSVNIETPKQDFAKLTIQTGKKRIDRQTAMICSILTEHYFVRVIFASEFNARELETHKIIEILGTQANVTVAEYVFSYLRRSLDRLWHDFQQRKRLGHPLKSSYQVGLLTGFRRKLERCDQQVNLEAASTKADRNALVRAQRDLETFVRTQFPKLSTHKTGRGRLDSGAYRHGCSDGEKIAIHRGVGSGGTTSERLLARHVR
jgi:hypothetical protein